MASTYINKARRAQIIDEFMEEWLETESYSTKEAAESEAREYRAALEALNNSQLVAEVEASGWGIL